MPSPPSVAMRPRVAARSLLSGAKPATMTRSHSGALIATSRRTAAAHCSAFADERRVDAGDGGERGRGTLIQSLALRLRRASNAKKGTYKRGREKRNLSCNRPKFLKIVERAGSAPSNLGPQSQSVRRTSQFLEQPRFPGQHATRKRPARAALLRQIRTAGPIRISRPRRLSSTKWRAFSVNVVCRV